MYTTEYHSWLQQILHLAGRPQIKLFSDAHFISRAVHLFFEIIINADMACLFHFQPCGLRQHGSLWRTRACTRSLQSDSTEKFGLNVVPGKHRVPCFWSLRHCAPVFWSLKNCIVLRRFCSYLRSFKVLHFVQLLTSTKPKKWHFLVRQFQSDKERPLLAHFRNPDTSLNSGGARGSYTTHHPCFPHGHCTGQPANPFGEEGAGNVRVRFFGALWGSASNPSVSQPQSAIQLMPGEEAAQKSQHVDPRKYLICVEMFGRSRAQHRCHVVELQADARQLPGSVNALQLLFSPKHLEELLMVWKPIFCDVGSKTDVASCDFMLEKLSSTATFLQLRVGPKYPYHLHWMGRSFEDLTSREPDRWGQSCWPARGVWHCFYSFTKFYCVH